MRSGLSVYGSSSMGAKRAAELYAFVMLGHGTVDDQVRQGGTFRDDGGPAGSGLGRVGTSRRAACGILSAPTA